MKSKQIIWIETGYEEVAKNGPDILTVDRLANLLSRSRSSFYHLFGNMSNYKQALLKYHWDLSLDIAKSVDAADSFYPDFAYILANNKNWTFCHIQMYHHREKDKAFEDIFNKVTSLIENKIGHLWAKMVDIDELPSDKTTLLYRVIRETIFAQLHYHNFSAELLDAKMKKLNRSLQSLMETANS